MSAPPATSILVEDGAVPRGVYVVRSGAVELVHEDEPVDGAGRRARCSAIPSFLTGRSPAFTVRAREQCELIVIPATRRCRT